MIHRARRLAAVLALFTLVGDAGAQSADRLAVSETASAFRLTVPVSRLVLEVPRETWTAKAADVGGATANPRYFHFESRDGAVLSGWFEPASRFRGAETHWKQDSAAWKERGLPSPAEVVFEPRGAWEAVRYAMPVPGGSSAHVRAHRIQAGTWIDLHLSVTAKEPYASTRQRVDALFQALSVQEKPREDTP